MIPFINFFGKQIGTYQILALIGIFVCSSIACRKCRENGYDDNDMIFLLLMIGVGIIIGGHLLYGITNIGKIINLFKNFGEIKSFKIFIDCLIVIFGGQVFYGGLIGGLIAGLITINKKKLDKQAFINMLAPLPPLFHFFGRIGCFLGGCCYGIESKVGFVYHNALIESANNIRRFPVQLVEAGFNLIVFFVLYRLQKKGKCKNVLLYIYLLTYGIIRFFLEFLRGDEYRGFLLGLSTSQIISLFFIILSITMIFRKKNCE